MKHLLFIAFGMVAAAGVQATKTSTSDRSSHVRLEDLPIDMLELISHKIDTPQEAYSFGSINSASRKIFKSSNPGGKTCWKFKSKMRIDRANKRVVFSDTVMSDLLQELLPGGQGSSFDANYRAGVEPGKRIYNGFELFYRCLNRITLHGYKIRDFNVQDMREFQRIGQLPTTPRVEVFHDPTQMLKTMLLRTHVIDRTLPRALVAISRHYTEGLRMIMPSRVKANYAPHPPLYYIDNEREFQSVTEESLRYYQDVFFGTRGCSANGMLGHQAVFSDNELVLATLTRNSTADVICQCKVDYENKKDRELGPHVAQWFVERGC